MLRALLAACALAFLLVFVSLTARRIGYPFALEWVESLALQQVQRVRAGQPLYAPPTLDYMAAPYGPLYVYAAAAPAALLPGGFLPLRLVSLLSALATLGLLAAVVWKETRSGLGALLAAALYAATFHASGGWMDLARVDSLFVFFLVLGVAVLRNTSGAGGAALAGLALALAFFTKQTALLPAAVVAAALLLWDRRRLAAFLGGFAVPLAAGLLALHRLTHGWYAYFAFRPHPIIPTRLLTFWTADLLRAVPIAFVLGALALLLPPAGDDAAARRRRRLAGGVAALVLAGWSGRVITGAVANALMPAFAGAALAFGLGAAAVLARVRTLPEPERARLEALALGALLLQLAILSYDPLAQLPTPADRAAGERLVRTLAATPGRVLVPQHPYLLAMAGKPAHADYGVLFDLVTYGGGETARRLLEEARAAIAEGRYDAIVLDDHAFMLEADVRRRYRLERPLAETEGAFVPVSGAPLRPASLWVPDGAGPGPRSSASDPPGSAAAVR